jgi:hypothetical protein
MTTKNGIVSLTDADSLRNTINERLKRGFFERLIIAADFGRFFSLGFLGSGRRRRGNQPLHGRFKSESVRADKFCFRHNLFGFTYGQFGTLIFRFNTENQTTYFGGFCLSKISQQTAVPKISN